MFKFEVPSLTVGTLDTLMTLSDDLVKTDTIVEQTVRKIEKTTAELFDRKASELSVGGKIHIDHVFKNILMVL
jgi:V-type H+-transporting ATPase subunit C